MHRISQSAECLSAISSSILAIPILVTADSPTPAALMVEGRNVFYMIEKTLRKAALDSPEQHVVVSRLYADFRIGFHEVSHCNTCACFPFAA